jgi:endogenous inhibitor of DNA gyrase (YacG/DUF329 family)
VPWVAASEFRPFCSKRCQLIDLGQWANEENRVPAGKNNDAETSMQIDIEDIEALLSDHPDEFFK